MGEQVVMFEGARARRPGGDRLMDCPGRSLAWPPRMWPTDARGGLSRPWWRGAPAAPGAGGCPRGRIALFPARAGGELGVVVRGPSDASVCEADRRMYVKSLHT